MRRANDLGFAGLERVESLVAGPAPVALVSAVVFVRVEGLIGSTNRLAAEGHERQRRQRWLLRSPARAAPTSPVSSSTLVLLVFLLVFLLVVPRLVHVVKMPRG